MSGQDKLTYYPFINVAGPIATVSQVALFDVFRGLSIMNAKNYEYTDRNGNLQGVLCDITLTANTPVETQLWTAPNTWKVRNAVRKFHFARNDMFREAGVTKSEMGKYGQTIRPYFDLCHATDDTTDFTYYESNPIIAASLCPGRGGENPQIIGEQARGGEWTRTMLTSADPSPLVLGTPQELELDDTWTIHLLGPHDTSGPPWASVGMVTAYNEDRMEVVTPSSAEETITADNPLALLQSQSVTGGEVAAIAEDQEMETPPYDIRDDGDSNRKVLVGDMRVVPYNDMNTGKVTSQTTTLRNVFLPAGYLAMSFSELLFGPNTENPDYCSVTIDVHGIVDCKDWIEA